MARKIVASGVGCSLVDRLNNTSFGARYFKPYLSKNRSDGRLVSGQLAFREEFEKYGAKYFQTILEEFINDRIPESK